MTISLTGVAFGETSLQDEDMASSPTSETVVQEAESDVKNAKSEIESGLKQAQEHLEDSAKKAENSVKKGWSKTKQIPAPTAFQE